MSLKQSIVIVNEYTLKTGSKSGSRGGTPGDYVVRYMARDLATEDVTPVKLQDTDSYILRYMARKEASERLNSVPEIKASMRAAQRDGGIAFGYGDVALSDARLKVVSKDIQDNFDKGKTVMKTVLSFDETYLREHGVLEPDFEFQKRGDFRGHIDQLKLRLAIMNGMEKLSRSYDDLQYVGVIQVDTAHVHCHLAMVDRGRGHIMPDGTQRGKLTEREKRNLRRGIDTWLDEKQTVRMMSSSVVYNKRNALCYIKKFTHRTMAQQGLPQFLLACLPENRNLWRASTNRKEMRKANSIVREFVVDLLREPDSGYREVVRDIQRYADERQNREGLTELEHNRLIRDGQERVIEDCMNAVYSVLKQIPESEMLVRTPMLDVMSMDYEDMASKAVDDPMIEFGFKLRSYSSRLDYHKKEYHKYRDELRIYDATEDKSEDSKVMGDFFREESEYNAMLMVKYQYFLSFLPPEDGFEEEFEKLMERKERLYKLEAMRKDPSFKKMRPEIAEEYGIATYGQYGGRRIKDTPGILDGRIEKLSSAIAEEEAEFRDKLKDSGFDYDGHGIIQKRAYPFDDVKALDLHHLGYDFPYDAQISQVNVNAFVKQANRRYDSFQAAKTYLLNSGQEEAAKTLPEVDVLFMKQYADKLSVNPVLITGRPDSGEFHRGRTVRLGRNYESDMRAIVESTVRAVQLGAV